MKTTIEAILDKQTLSKEDLAVLETYESNVGQNRLYSFFTPIWLCEVMYKLAKRYGFDVNGNVLEPACGTGNFLMVLDNPQNATAFELDPLNFKIAQKRAPQTTIYNQYFETAFLESPRYTTKLKNNSTWLTDAPFDLVIGNPPYGKYKNLYSSYFKPLKIKQIELFFMYQSMQLLKKDGLLVFITASSFLRNKDTYTNEKQLIGKYAELVDAYRMPKVFKNTQVPTDIIILRRK
ncbi:N-6 DNA methylase [Kordia sp. YSTF-M3]|uniref:site-specific DNA-methyltransferase (adenine-specific) n=1 Tax=Kordia aestuariivivens TaxID=2759037 RepID=A0ABR7Q6K7_9FLAO|nr:N-6 DNA methylase [Kordia aestuariivivens]MBC8753964.1 N-6 DNA methylase [Kordia aestuariivivens]